MAIEAGIGRIVVDSFDELDRLDMLYAETGIAPKVLLRLTPGIKAETHDYISTGQDDSKFGFTVSTGAAERAIERAQMSPAVEVLGIHAHIGSQVFAVGSLGKAAGVIGEIATAYDFAEMSVGGGLGVPYVDDETAPTIGEWARSSATPAPLPASPPRSSPNPVVQSLLRPP